MGEQVHETKKLLSEIGHTAHPGSRHHFSFDGAFFVCRTTFSCPAILAPREAADHINRLQEELIDFALRSPNL